ncbi:DUF3093 domain-containing protein [Angustibacter sp. McL0619]|uniref:DUF3093 domain-containing protein n=1 Tax=Angustibacter sp. McL0619 TaxID=3415676 RepID=UPI003CF4A25F
MKEPAVPAEHHERLLPSAPVWVAVLAVSASLGLTAVRPLGWNAGAVVALLAVAVAAAALLASSAHVVAAHGELRAGRARIEAHHLGRVRAVDPKRMAELRGPKTDARAYLCQRAWIRGGVVVEVVDPQDPVPYWLVSSRRPERLAAALRAQGAGSARDEPSDGTGQAHSRHTG